MFFALLVSVWVFYFERVLYKCLPSFSMRGLCSVLGPGQNIWEAEGGEFLWT